MMITDIEDFFTKGCGRCERFATPDCSTRRWIGGLNELRAICRSEGLAEEVKWAHPCYMFAGRNVAIIGAFRTDYRITFFDAALLSDPDGVLEKQGAFTEHPDMIRLTDNAQAKAMEPVIRAFLKQARDFAAAGIRPPKSSRDIDLPEELIEAMDADPELAEAFHRLTPGRQKSYAFYLGAAKKSETRFARLAGKRDQILQGKGALDR